MTPRAALDVATAFLDAFTAGDLDHTATYLADDFTFDGPIAHYRSAEEFLTGSRPFVETLHGPVRSVAFRAVSPIRACGAPTVRTVRSADRRPVRPRSQGRWRAPRGRPQTAPAR
jgi:SnoaL-like domain